MSASAPLRSARSDFAHPTRSGEEDMSAVEMLTTAAPVKSIPSADELVRRTRALAPRLHERALRAERDRNIPRESVEEYIDAGLIRTIMPKRWGGYEHDHEVAFDI